MSSTGFSEKAVVLESGEEVAYLERGDAGAGRTLLCLHGMTMDAKSFLPFVEALGLPDDVRVLVPDAMAHGSRIAAAVSLGDEYQGWTAEERAADAAAFLAALGDVGGPVDVYGYSMGGATALALAEDFPALVDRVCLLAPACGFTENSIAETQRGEVVYSYTSVEEAVAMAERIGFPPEVARTASPGMAAPRANTDYDAKRLWTRTWTGLLANMGADAAAMLETCGLRAKKVAASGRKVAVIQGSEDLVVHSDVHSTIAAAMGAGQCEVTLLQGFGHFGSPTDPSGNLGASGAPAAAAFFAY